MRVCGIAAEYNPFHTGHARQLAETRRMLGAETAIVCAMSGNFVQRGDYALLDKYARAEMAVRGGADLVVELPLAAALSSAEGFARGAASVLAALGCGVMSFGAETPDGELLLRAARALDSLPPGRGAQAPGLSYAAARQRALCGLDPQAAALLDRPNNTLAIEYCRAMEAYGMKPLAISREGAPHDAGAPAGGFAPASYLRGRILAGDLATCLPYLPASGADLLRRTMQRGEAPVRLPGDRLLPLLRRLHYDGRLQTGAKDGFDERLRRAVCEAASYEEVIERTRTRRFPAARVRRTLLRLVLDLPPGAEVRTQYLRVLAIGERGRALLRNAKGGLPVLVKPAAEKRLPEALQPALRRDAFADGLYELALPAAASGGHFRQTPFCLPAPDSKNNP